MRQISRDTDQSLVLPSASRPVIAVSPGLTQAQYSPTTSPIRLANLAVRFDADQHASIKSGQAWPASTTSVANQLSLL